jgi:hypothetical protein
MQVGPSYREAASRIHWAFRVLPSGDSAQVMTRRATLTLGSDLLTPTRALSVLLLDRFLSSARFRVRQYFLKKGALYFEVYFR